MMSAFQRTDSPNLCLWSLKVFSLTPPPCFCFAETTHPPPGVCFLPAPAAVAVDDIVLWAVPAAIGSVVAVVVVVYLWLLLKVSYAAPPLPCLCVDARGCSPPVRALAAPFLAETSVAAYLYS